MPVKRRLPKTKVQTLPLHLVSTAERLIQLLDDHCAAAAGDDQSFYSDGRHEELCGLLPTINAALGIKPWDDDPDAVIRNAVDAAKERSAR
ncbi:hypothetical protein ACUXST_000143 [Sphingomonas sp. F9_3S_D5_B_2]